MGMARPPIRGPSEHCDRLSISLELRWVFSLTLDVARIVRIMFGMHTDDFSYRDALPNGPVHRRGAGLNPGNRFETVRLHVLGEELDRQWVERQNEDGSANRVERQVFFDRTQRIINQVSKTSDVPFDWTL